MNKNNAILMGVGAILALVISLPLEWMTIHNAPMQFNGGPQGLGNMIAPSLTTMTVKVTGINGHITFLVKLPIWLIVVVGMIGVLLAVLNCLRVASIPRIAVLIPLSLSTLYVVITLVITIGIEEATVGIGIFIALIGLGLGYAQALTYRINATENTVSREPIQGFEQDKPVKRD